MVSFMKEKLPENAHSVDWMLFLGDMFWKFWCMVDRVFLFEFTSSRWKDNVYHNYDYVYTLLNNR